MKKLNALFLVVMALFAIGFTSCGGNDEDAELPIINVTAEPAAAAMLPGATLQYTITVSTANGDLTTFTCVGAGSIQPAAGSGVDASVTTWDAAKGEFKSGTVSTTVKYNVKLGADLEAGDSFDIVFSVADEKEKINSVTKTITIASTGTLKTHDITMGGQNNNTGSFAASFTGTVYTKDQAIANNTAIDIIYYVGNTNAETIFSPADTDVQSITWGGTINWTNWTTKNPTKFVKVTSADFDAATFTSVATLATGASLTKANHLVLGDVYAFTTTGSKSGLFKVTALTTGEAGSVTISVKIQNTTPSK